MRRTFADCLFQQAKSDERIMLITGDLGYKVFDEFREKLPNQFINVGAAEQAGVGIAVGLALSGKIPFFYSITPFLLARPYETIRNYLDHERIGVKLVGSGRDSDYKHDGFSHFAGDDKNILINFPNISAVWPSSKQEVEKYTKDMAKDTRPWYINLAR